MITDLLIHELVKSSGVTVVERKNIDKVFSEYSVQANPYIDLKNAKKLGKGLGADCIIVGSIAGLGYPLYVTDSFEYYYEVKFGEKSKCAVKVSSIDENGKEIVQEGTGTYSYARDEFSGGLMFKLQVVFKGAKIARLRKINWAYPINLNNEKNSFSLNFPLDSQSDEIVRLTLAKEE